MVINKVTNWRDMVGVQAPRESADTFGLLYMVPEFKEDGNGVLNISINKQAVSKENATYTEDTIKDAILSVMENHFPVFEVPKDASEESLVLFYQRGSDKIAQQSRRGFGNTIVDDYLYYLGKNVIDSPIIVYEFDGAYGIFVHPKIELYGFKIVKN